MPSAPTTRDRDVVPWLLLAAMLAVLAVVGGVVVVAATDNWWWDAAAAAFVCAATAGGAVAVAHLIGGSRRRARAPREASGATAGPPPRDWRGPTGSPAVLVVASSPFDAFELARARGRPLERGAAILVVAPALTRTGLRFWVSDTDEAATYARVVERTSVGALNGAGLTAAGHVGAGDPLTAIADALRFFDADEIVLLLHTAGPHRYRERSLRGDVEQRFGRPARELDRSLRAAS